MWRSRGGICNASPKVALERNFKKLGSMLGTLSGWCALMLLISHWHTEEVEIDGDRDVGTIATNAREEVSLAGIVEDG